MEEKGAEAARWRARGGGAARIGFSCGVAARRKYRFSGDEEPAGADQDRPVDAEQSPKEHCEKSMQCFEQNVNVKHDRAFQHSSLNQGGSCLAANEASDMRMIYVHYISHC